MISEWRQCLQNSAARNAYRQKIIALNETLKCCTEIFVPEEDPAPPSDNSRASTGGTLSAEAFTDIPFAIKDNISLRGRGMTCASAMLKEFISPYNATVVQKLIDNGAVPVAKTNLDEFGMGSSTEHSCFGATANPWNIEYVAGGSSGGSAAAVAAGMVPFALGSDTGGSVRQPASFCGVYGLKPTYGVLSRFGLVAYASSLDTVGILATSPHDVREVFGATRGLDAHDQTSVATPDETKEHARVPRVIGYVDTLYSADEVIRTHYRQMVATCEKMGYRCVAVEIPHQALIAPAYYTIASAEASTNLSRYDGVKYGMRHGFYQSPSEMTRAARSAGFGTEVKMRILLGSYVLRAGFQERYYIRAQKIRQYLKMKMRLLFKDIDILLLPTFPTLPFRIAGNEMSSFQQKQADIFTCIANLTEQPALSMPVGMHASMPIGMQCIARPCHEDILFDLASRYRTHFEIGTPPHYLKK